MTSARAARAWSPATSSTPPAGSSRSRRRAPSSSARRPSARRRGAIAFEPAGEQLLKGKAAPVPAWRALRVVAERGGRGRGDAARAAVRRPRRRAAPAQGPVPRHGARAARRARLDHRARPASARAASRGSSRSTSTASSRRVFWHAGRSPAYGEGITFWALGEMVRARAGLARDRRRGDDAREARRDRRASSSPDPDRAALDRAGAPGAARRRRGAGRRRDELFGAWRTFFERIAGTGTVVLVFEDLHWADAGLLDFIDHLLEWSRDVPILIVTLARPGAARAAARLGRRPAQLHSRSTSSRSTEQAMRELLAGFVPGLPEPAVASDRRARRRHPALRGRDGPDARRRRPAARARGRRLRAGRATSASSPSRRRSTR